MIKKIKNILNNKKEKNTYIVIVSSVILSISFVLFESFSTASTIKTEPLHVDTFIPKGFVLVPIDIENKNSLNTVIGDYGVINLYEKKNKFKSRLVASSIRVLRAPNNPNVFAVMVHESHVQQILNAQGPFKIVIQNPKMAKTRFSKQKILPKKRRLNIYSSEKKVSL